MSEIFWAHTSEHGPWEPLVGHLQQVCGNGLPFDGAAVFAEAFGAGDLGRLLGLWHDLGKYSHAFQRYLQGGGRDVH